MSPILLLNRRSFMQSMLALAAAPAIVRLGSLMPVSVYDWTRDVREVVRYDIHHDAMAARWDLLSGNRQFHCDMLVTPFGTGGDQGGEALRIAVDSGREAALKALAQFMRQKNIPARGLQRLPLPEGIRWARYLA